ncbi:hypothetical protein MVEG_04687 [Podila verticillata NRRL 6337]|nr:hypothetical protein MVEG_04687 [Podila verticillata NRRL 6337]
MDTPLTSTLPPRKERLLETAVTYFKFGFTTFGGPAAHVSMLHEEVVTRRKWISNEQFTELFAICQALPGPSSTELAYSVSLVRSGFLCACLAFLLWSIPGGIVMTVVGILIANLKGGIPEWATRLEQGLSSAAIGLVALAAYRMSTTLATDKLTRILALVSGGVSALYTAPWLLPVIMVSGGIISFVYDAHLVPFLVGKRLAKERRKEEQKQLKDLEQGHGQGQGQTVEEATEEGAHEQSTGSSQKGEITSVHGSIRHRASSDQESVKDWEAVVDVNDEELNEERLPYTYSKKLGLVFLTIFLALLITSILVRALVPTQEKVSYGQLFATFYFVGSIIIGGGPVIIPLLKNYIVDTHWMTDQQFLIGLALIQSIPGPNFNFAAFVGAVAMVNSGLSGVVGAIPCFIAIFAPGILLKNAVIPFWQFLREKPAVKMVFRGVNACALGLVFSAVWLLWVQTEHFGGNTGYHNVIACAAFVASGYLDIPAPLVIVVGGGGMGAIEYGLRYA